MTALASERLTKRYGQEPLPALWCIKVKAASKTFAGGIAVVDAGYVTPGRTATGLMCVGRFEDSIDNTLGASGDLSANVLAGVFRWANSAGADAITQADLGSYCYIVDDQTVAKTDGANTRSRCGVITNVLTDGVEVLTGFVPAQTATVSVAGGGSVAGDYKESVRAASTTNVTLTAVSTTMDGLTLVAGDRVLIKDQSAGAANGIYIVGTVASALAPLTRAADADSSADVTTGFRVTVEEGTANAGKTFQLQTVAPIVLGTTALVFAQSAAPQVLSGTATLSSGTVTVSAAITANSRITCSRKTMGTVPGHLSVPSSGRTTGTSFVISSSEVTETSTVDWVVTG